MKSTGRSSAFFLLVLFLSASLVACAASAGAPDDAVERYLEAIVATDGLGAANAACAGWEQQALLESAAYEGVNTQLQELDCQVVTQDGESAQVACNGQIVFSYAGGENQVDELGGRRFTASVEGGEWKLCGPGSDALAQTESETATPTPQELAKEQPSETIQPTSEPTQQLSPTADTRPLPKDWRAWPVVPSFSPWLIELYERGLAQGNDPSHFTRAGDCQNIPDAFLGFYDKEGRYFFRNNEDYLHETRDFYAGSWGRDGQAVDGGFNFPAIFTPLRADPEICNEGENPLACEIRIYQPAIILIAMEFVYEGRTAKNYEDYLHQAVDYALANNVIPILLTKADNVEGDHSINLTIAQTAYSYDIPLINWWRAAQPLEGHGIDWERDADSPPEGFHITAEGWTQRSYWTLKTLDALRQFLPDIDA